MAYDKLYLIGKLRDKTINIQSKSENAMTQKEYLM